jgi:hypothetical protein
MLRGALREATRLGDYGGRGARAVPSMPKSWSRRGSNLTTYMEKVEDMISFPVLRACANRDRVRL